MRIVLFLITLVCALCGSVYASEDWKIYVNGTMRDIVVTAPEGLDKPALVIAMHGMNGWHKGYQNDTKFDGIAEREKFVVVYPNGVDGAWDITGNRDIEFIEAIIDTMVIRYDVDRSRVYPTGWSMGGMMSYHLACSIPEKIAAIGPTSGYPLWGNPVCSNARLVPIIHIHGTSDGVVGYEGLHPFLENKVAQYGCPSTPEVIRPYPSSRTGSNTYLERWGPCENNGMSSEIVLITIDGMDHWYTTENRGSHVNESEEIWAFVKNYAVGQTAGYRLTVNTTGEGSVTREPKGSAYEEGTSVTLTAVPSEGWEFKGWSSEDISGEENTVTFVMDSDKTVSALFSRSPDEEGNYLLNGDFSSGSENWILNVWGGEAAGDVRDGEYEISISSLGSENYDIQLVQPGLYLEKGETYRVSFDAYASAEREIEVNVEMAQDPFTSYLPQLEYFNLTGEKQTYSFTFTMENSTDVNGRLSLNAGSSSENIFIDNVSLTSASSTHSIMSSKVRPFRSPYVHSDGSKLHVKFKAKADEYVTLTLFNLRGEKIQSSLLKTISGRVYSRSFDLSHIARGFYVMKISDEAAIFHSEKIFLSK